MFVGSLILILNCACVRFVAWRVSGAIPDLLDRLLATLLLIPLQIITIGLVLGYTGVLNGPALSFVHVVFALLAWRFFPAPPPMKFPALTARERSAAVLLGAVLILFALTAGFGSVLIHDALTYRLSRVAHWLQSGTILQFPTNELRQSYHPINVDLMMAWSVLPFAQGYPLVQLTQTFGGLLLVTAMLSLGRSAGLPRDGLLAVLFAGFALPNFCVQWSSAQSDLVTAGLLWAGIALLLRNPDDLQRTAVGWGGVAASVGAKGTVLYLGLGLLALAFCWSRTLKERTLDWRRQLLCALPALLVLAAPRYIENQFQFGNPFAPSSAFALNHGDAEKTDWLSKTRLNLVTYLVQAVEPAANPPLLRTLSRPIWEATLNALPKDDPYDNSIYPRHEYLREFGPLQRPGADTISTGWMIPLLACIGALSLLTRHRGQSWWLRLGWVLCAVLFLLVFSGLFLWWPTSFRYFVLLTPPMAILTATLFGRLPIRFTYLLIGTAVFTTGDTWLRCKNSGLAQFKPDPTELLYLSDLENQKAVINELMPPGSTLAVLLPWNSPLTGFYRQTNDVHVEIIRERDLLHLPDADYLRDQRWDALVSLPLPIPKPAPGMTYLAVNHRVTGQPQYLLHLPASTAQLPQPTSAP